MSSVLLAYDERVDAEAAAAAAAGSRVVTLAFTSRPDVREAVHAALVRAGCEPVELPAAARLNEAAEDVRGEYIELVAHLRTALPELDLTEYFRVGSGSAWWYSLVAEKNTWKTRTLNELARLEAVSRALGEQGARALVCGIDSPPLAEALSRLAAARRIGYTTAVAPAPRGFTDRSGAPRMRHAVRLARSVAGLARRCARIRTRMRGVSRLAPRPGALLAVTYFPAFDAALAQRGVYRDAYYTHLQEALERQGVEIDWLALYVDAGRMSFGDAMDAATGFSAKGTNLRFLEEYVTLGVVVRALAGSVRLALRHARIADRVAGVCVVGGNDVYPIMRDEWYASFGGSVGFLGLVYRGAFERALADHQAETCLFPCEMHAWERALVDARDCVRPGLPTVGYQSGTVSRMLLNYFNHPSETDGSGAHPLPAADVIAANGRVPYRQFAECGWPAERLARVEAVRYTHLKPQIDVSSRRAEVVLVALSISPEEGVALLNAALQAFSAADDVEVWVKAHPFVALPAVLARAGIEEGGAFRFTVRSEPMSVLLPQVGTVIVGESSVAVEALAYGCRVALVEGPEWVDMSPLRGIGAPAIVRPATPAQMLAAVRDARTCDWAVLRETSREAVASILELGPTGDDVPHAFLAALGYSDSEG